MYAAFDAMTPVDILVLAGILGSLLYTAQVYRTRTKERALALQAQKTDTKAFKLAEKSLRDEMDREPGGTASFV